VPPHYNIAEPVSVEVIDFPDGLRTAGYVFWGGDRWVIRLDRRYAGKEFFHNLLHEIGHIVLGHVLKDDIPEVLLPVWEKLLTPEEAEKACTTLPIEDYRQTPDEVPADTWQMSNLPYGILKGVCHEYYNDDNAKRAVSNWRRQGAGVSSTKRRQQGLRHSEGRRASWGGWV